MTNDDRRKWRRQYLNERVLDHFGGLVSTLDTLEKMAAEDDNQEAREAFSQAHEEVKTLAERLFAYL